MRHREGLEVQPVSHPPDTTLEQRPEAEQAGAEQEHACRSRIERLTASRPSVPQFRPLRERELKQASGSLGWNLGVYHFPDPVDFDELRARLRKMTDDELVVREDSVRR